MRYPSPVALPAAVRSGVHGGRVLVRGLGPRYGIAASSRVGVARLAVLDYRLYPSRLRNYRPGDGEGGQGVYMYAGYSLSPACAACGLVLLPVSSCLVLCCICAQLSCLLLPSCIPLRISISSTTSSARHSTRDKGATTYAVKPIPAVGGIQPWANCRRRPRHPRHLTHTHTHPTCVSYCHRWPSWSRVRLPRLPQTSRAARCVPFLPSSRQQPH